MSNLGGNLLLTMPGGEVEVSYTIGVTGTRERAMAIIDDAKAAIDGVKAEGIIVDEAEGLLQQAKDALASGLYAEAEQIAEDAKASALDTRGLANSAVAEDAGKTVGLDGAKDLLREAEAAYEDEVPPIADPMTAGLALHFGLPARIILLINLRPSLQAWKKLNRASHHLPG